MSKHRQIYEQHHGPIPEDDGGRTYDVHHIDGNRQNNDPSNLKAVSIQEHYDIHRAQSDYGACLAIAIRMETSPEEKSELAREAQKQKVIDGTHAWLGDRGSRKKVADGTHHFLGDRNPVHKLIADGTYHCLGPKHNNKRVAEGTHQWLGDRNPSRKRAANGTHHWLGPESNRKRIEAGTHNLQGVRNPVHKLIAEGRHPSQTKKTCPRCGKTVDSMNYVRWHGDRCRGKS